MDVDKLISALIGIATFANSAWLIYAAYRKNKPEVKKLEVEADSEIVDAANLNLEGAKVSAQMLLDRINELKKELNDTKIKYEEEMARIEKERRADLLYFTRRVKDMERESRDYRTWAAKLAKQVIDAGQIPAPFIPSIGDSENVAAVRLDLEDKMNQVEKDTQPKK